MLVFLFEAFKNAARLSSNKRGCPYCFISLFLIAIWFAIRNLSLSNWDRFIANDAITILRLVSISNFSKNTLVTEENCKANFVLILLKLS